MATYLLTWNPDKFDWTDLAEDLDEFQKLEYLNGNWSCGRTKRIAPGDRFFLLKQGKPESKGIMGAGYTTTTSSQEDHFLDESKTARYVGVRFDALLDPAADPILERTILERELPDVHWSPQGSGVSVPPPHDQRLEELWQLHLRATLGESSYQVPFQSPDQVSEHTAYHEGAVQTVNVNRYERDPRARRACIQHYGPTCKICQFNFSDVFGEIGRDYIHVHHLTPVSELGPDYAVNPIRDLLPVCPNCHAMLHTSDPPLFPAELIAIVNRNQI